MGANKFNYDQLYTELLSRVPDLRISIERTFGADYDLDKETPGAYPIFEDVVLTVLLENLDSGQDKAFLKRLFDFFEEMAISGDGNVTDLLRIGILEPLVDRPEQYHRAASYMGKKTMEFADLEKRTQSAQKRTGHAP
jgi:hypothetical protein